MFCSLNIDLSPSRFLHPRLLAPQPNPLSLAPQLKEVRFLVGFYRVLGLLLPRLLLIKHKPAPLLLAGLRDETDKHMFSSSLARRGA